MTWLVDAELVAAGTPAAVRGIALFGVALAVPVLGVPAFAVATLAGCLLGFTIGLSVDESLSSDDLLSLSEESDED